MVGDEWLYWSKTNMILANGWVPVPEVFDYSPPFYPHICAAVATIFGSDLDVFRTVSSFFGALSVVVLYMLGKEMYDKKTGLLSAALFCFSSYHCFYSRLYKLESFTIFLILVFLYFFWKSETSKKIRYSCLSGAFLGLAIASRYLPVFLVAALVIYKLWIDRLNLRSILNKRIAVIFLFSVAFSLPHILGLFYSGVGLHPFYYYTSSMFEQGGVATRTIEAFTLNKLVTSGFERLTDVLAYGHGLLNPLWDSLFKISTILLVIIVVLIYFYNTLKLDQRSTFLLACLITLLGMLLVMRAAKYYLIYTLIFYYLMFSNIFVSFLKSISKKLSLGNSLKSIFAMLFLIYLFSTFYTGIFSPIWDKGEYSWVSDAVDFIKKDSYDIDHRPIRVGTFVFVEEPIEYESRFINLSIEAYRLGIINIPREQAWKSRTIILKEIDTLRPDYIVFLRGTIISFYELYFKGKLKEEMLKDYRVVYQGNTYPYSCIILKRKVISETYELQPTVGNKTSGAIVNVSIPKVMKFGKSYTIVVKVKNTEKYSKSFTVRIYSDRFLTYIYHRVANATINGGGTKIFKFKAVAFKEYEGDIPVTVELYTKDEKLEIADSVTKYIKLVY